MRQADRRACTLSKILESATSLFSSRGIDVVTLEEVAQNVGLSKGSIYTHFKSKEELVEAVVQQVARTRPRASSNLQRLAQSDPNLRLLMGYWATRAERPTTMQEAG